jgi:hypothetical protein
MTVDRLRDDVVLAHHDRLWHKSILESGPVAEIQEQ